MSSKKIKASPKPSAAPSSAPPAEMTVASAQKGIEETRSTLPRFLREKTPLWLRVAAGVGAFFSLLGFAFLISPYNRAELLTPSAEALEELGLNASQIADRLEYAATISPMMLNASAGVYFMAMISLLVVATRLQRSGVYAYILLTFVNTAIFIAYGLFSPALLLIPMTVTVTAMLNREFLR